MSLATYTRAVPAGKLVARCSTTLEGEARALLDALAARADLADGLEVDWGWSRLRLVIEGAALVLCEPNFMREGWVPRVQVTLAVKRAQEQLAAEHGVAPVPARYDERVFAASGALARARVALRRDPGWVVTAREGDAEPGFEELRVGDMMGLRPGLLPVLALPPGVAIEMDGDRVEKITFAY